MLSRTLIQQLATNSSYSRGESYYNNHYVRRIKRTDNTFTGKVEGSELYTVSLTLSETQPTFDCDCLYDFEGICKHCVAFGLAVIDQFGPVVQLTEPESTMASIDPNTLWLQTSTEQKLTFLRQLLDKQADLRMQLFQFAGLNKKAPQIVGTENDRVGLDEATSSNATNFGLIDSISTEVFEALSDLRFDEETLMDDDDYDRYSEESPDPAPIIEPVLSAYAELVTKSFREGRLTDAMTVFLGVYEGSQAATEVQEDDLGIIDDYPTLTWDIWNGMLSEPYAQLASRVLHPDQIGQALGLLAERVTFFIESEEKDSDEDNGEWDDETTVIYYNLKQFEPLLLALVTDVPSAQVVQQAIKKYSWQQFGTEYIQLRIAEVLQDSTLWLQTADQFANSDLAIGLQLLQRRRQLGDLPTLLQTLHRLNKQFPTTFDAFILDSLDETLLTPGPDLTLYLTALENRCLRMGQIDDYLKLREFWTENRRNEFIDSLLPKTEYGWVTHPLFYAQVLHTEGRSDDLLAWLKTIKWHYMPALPDILRLAAQSHPNECMDMVMHHATYQLENGKRDRSLYQTIAGWLGALNMIPSLKPQVAIYANHLAATYNRLSALKDELRLKGLIRK